VDLHAFARYAPRNRVDDTGAVLAAAAAMLRARRICARARAASSNTLNGLVT
jgi:hypothetical protein